jgi:protoporphyrin/coproporphyrin ferrochelatase
MTESFVDVALLAFGAPGGPEQITEFLVRMTGRPPTPETLKVVEERYELIGGASPLPDITARQARALQARLVQELAFPIRVRPGFLYAQPTVAECLEELDGHEVIAVPLSPFSSRLTSGKYREALDAAQAAAEARAKAGAGQTDAKAGRKLNDGRPIPLVEGWYAERGFVQAISRRVAEALDGCDVNEWVVLFTAHNVPSETVAEGDPYVEQLQQTISQLVPAIMPGDWRFAFQSKGRGGGEWLAPEVDDTVRAIAADGWKKILVVPVGFVSDNVETLYDLDIMLRRQIESLAMEYRRSAAPNDSPPFIEALADVVIEYLARRPVEHQLHRPDGPHKHG